MSTGPKMPDGSIRAEGDITFQAIRSAKWTTFYSIFQAASGPVYKIILAKLFLPREYAYLAVISLFISLSRLLNNVGISESVIQKDRVTDRQLSVLFYLSILGSVLLGMLLFVTSPLIERFYRYENLSPVLRLVGVAILLNGVPRVFRVYLEKNLLFRETAILHLVRNAVDMGSSVAFIMLGYGVPGFVYGTILSAAVYAVSNALVALRRTNFRLRPCFDVREALPFLKFGMFISVKQVVTFAASHLDEVLIGKFLPREVLGYYFFAKDFLNKPLTLITQSFTQVLFAFFSKIKTQTDRLRRAYNKATYSLALIAFPLFMGIAVTANVYVPLLFGRNWLPSIGIIQVFALLGIFRVLTANIATSLLYTVNKPDIVLYIDLAVNAGYFVLMIVLARFGLACVLVLFTLQTVVKTAALQIEVGKSVGNRALEYLGQLRSAFLSAALMSLAVFALQHLTGSVRPAYRFAAVLGAGILTYGAVLWLLDRGAYRQFGRLLRSRKIE